MPILSTMRGAKMSDPILHSRPFPKIAGYDVWWTGEAADYCHITKHDDPSHYMETLHRFPSFPADASLHYDGSCDGQPVPIAARDCEHTIDPRDQSAFRYYVFHGGRRVQVTIEIVEQ
jgi:hypothetical protein